jgi:hypothetical protein
MPSRTTFSLLISVLSSVACANNTCTSLGIVREMSFETSLPQGLEPGAITLELCFGSVCDFSTLRASESPSVVGLHCEDIDGRTRNYPTQCAYGATDRKLQLSTNTAYGGHAGSESLVLTAIVSSGARTELLRGTVRYEDTTDEAARGACTDAWKGTFTKE